MAFTTGLLQINPWMTGTDDLDALAFGTAELSVDPAGAPWASLRLRMPSLDDPDRIGGRWLRVDLVERRLEYLLDLDCGGEVSREVVWPYDAVELDVRHHADEESLLHAFATMADVATELQIRPLSDEMADLHELDGTRWTRTPVPDSARATSSPTAAATSASSSSR